MLNNWRGMGEPVQRSDLQSGREGKGSHQIQCAVEKFSDCLAALAIAWCHSRGTQKEKTNLRKGHMLAQWIALGRVEWSGVESAWRNAVKSGVPRRLEERRCPCNSPLLRGSAGDAVKIPTMVAHMVSRGTGTSKVIRLQNSGQQRLLNIENHVDQAKLPKGWEDETDGVTWG